MAGASSGMPGVRGDFIHTPLIPADPGSGRPEFPADTITKVSPKIGLAVFCARRRRRAGRHAAAQPPSARASGRRRASSWRSLTTPRCKPERTASFDAASSSASFHNRLSLDATWFYNRFSRSDCRRWADRLTRLSHIQSDNLVELAAAGRRNSAARLRPARWFRRGRLVHLLDSEILLARWLERSGAQLLPRWARN